VSGLLIGYARVSTGEQDLTAQRDGLHALGVEPERIYVDHGLTATHRDRPGLREALAACRAGDTLVGAPAYSGLLGELLRRRIATWPRML
jgi:DNA invertase Pin-like site-specific DNA recombinase